MYLSLTKTKFQKRGGWDMKKSWLLGVLMLLAVLPVGAQQVMYSNLKELVENRGDTVTTLKIEKRTKNQIYLMGGADYRITVDDNPGLCRYLKSRCYAVRVDTSLYVNCRKMRYKRYRFGQWYAPATRKILEGMQRRHITMRRRKLSFTFQLFGHSKYVGSQIRTSHIRFYIFCFHKSHYLLIIKTPAQQ